jgi:hypothetical protein
MVSPLSRLLKGGITSPCHLSCFHPTLEQIRALPLVPLHAKNPMFELGTACRTAYLHMYCQCKSHRFVQSQQVCSSEIPLVFYHSSQSLSLSRHRMRTPRLQMQLRSAYDGCPQQAAHAALCMLAVRQGMTWAGTRDKERSEQSAPPPPSRPTLSLPSPNNSLKLSSKLLSSQHTLSH